MSNFFARSRERRLLRAGLLYRRGRVRMIWLNGVLYFGGSLFLLFNAIDYIVEPAALPTGIQLASLFGALILCVIAGYLYGLFAWRQLDRTFGGR